MSNPVPLGTAQIEEEITTLVRLLFAQRTE